MLNSDTLQRYISDNSGSGTFLIKDSGSGNYIATWDVDIAQPTNGQLSTIATILADDKATTSERAWRNSELQLSDWTQILDSPVGVQAQADWANYRQALRDMPSLSGFPNSHTRPTAPS